MALLNRKLEALSTVEYEIINVNDYMIGLNAKQRHNFILRLKDGMSYPFQLWTWMKGGSAAGVSSHFLWRIPHKNERQRIEGDPAAVAERDAQIHAGEAKAAANVAVLSRQQTKHYSRAYHIDSYYCAKNHNTIRQYSVLVKKMLGDAGYPDMVVAYMSSHDKAKIAIGEPKLPIAWSASGTASLVPVSDDGQPFNDARDHDYSAQSLVPSVNPISELYVPDDRNVDKAKPAVYKGTAHVTLKDAVFQASAPVRHMTELWLPPRKALLAFFIFTGLDSMVVGRTAPQQSWANEAERVMSVLNLGRQGCALSRTLMDSVFQKPMNTLGGMNAIRKADKDSQKAAAERASKQAQQERSAATAAAEEAQPQGAIAAAEETQAEMRVGEAEMRHRDGKMWPSDSHHRHPKAPGGLTWLRVSA
eukprot:jgi/Tetstr1/462545/TSEL_007533.t1